ncbi:MAG: TetR/AcrR family transcriptional regulator [Gammaproteobacteria bacterium]
MNARDRILVAFRVLVLSEPFDGITTFAIIRRAGVARSTFYAHFKGKNDLLLSSMGPILSVFAAACRGVVDPRVLVDTLEHVWENRVTGRVFFQGPVSVRLAREMVRLLERERMDASRRHFLVNGLLGTLGAWTAGQLPLTATELSEVLLRLTAPTTGVFSPPNRDPNAATRSRAETPRDSPG